MKRQMSLAARIAHAANRMVCHSYHTLDIVGRHRPGPAGAAIIVCNHVSGLDPMLIQAAVSRRIIWMMAKEYYELKSLRWFFRSLDAIPVNRGGRDTAATRQALRALAEENVLGIFPEGRLEPTAELLPFQPGVALLAVKSRATVFPAYITGTHRADNIAAAVLRPGEARLRFGPPMQFGNVPEKGASTRAVAEIEAAVAHLRSESLPKPR